MSFSNYLENLLLDVATGRALPTLPDLRLALSTTTPAEDGTNVTEPSGNGYARVDIGATEFAAAAAGTTDNDNVISWAQATGNWGTITHVVAYDAATGGNMLWFAALGTATAVNTNDTFSIPAGDLDVSLD